MNIKLDLYSTIIALSIMNTTISQVAIDYNKSQCTQCNMIIKDNRFSAQAASKKGKVFNFDAIECLVNFLKVSNQDHFKHFWVSDYKSPSGFLNAHDAIYVQSQAIKSPMGANLAAFENIANAKEIQKENNGTIYSWSEIRAKFNNQKLGETNQEHQHHDHFRPDAQAPIGVMGDHLHKKKV